MTVYIQDQLEIMEVGKITVHVTTVKIKINGCKRT